MTKLKRSFRFSRKRLFIACLSFSTPSAAFVLQHHTKSAFVCRKTLLSRAALSAADDSIDALFVDDSLLHNNITMSSTSDAASSTPLQPQFGQVVQLRRPSATAPAILTESYSSSLSSSPSSSSNYSSSTTVQDMLRRNAVVAVASIFLAIANYLWQYTHPISSLQLLAGLQASSPPLSIIGTNNKPTVVDFWAPWCENCKAEAPTLYQVHEEFKDRINFVLVNGDVSDAATWKAIDTFGVDAIPHMALVDASGNVQTALIGMIPKHVLEQDLQVLIQQQQQQQQDKGATSNGESTQLPYQMLDAFANRPSERRVHFEEVSP